MSENVQLTDLDIITRYSIAVRAASANRDELIYTLRADLAWLERGYRVSRPGRPVETGPEADDTAATRIDAGADAPVDAPAEPDISAQSEPVSADPEPKRIAARKTPAKKTPAKKTPAKTSPTPGKRR